MDAKIIKEKLLEAGVKNLQEFGYPAANTENILTDMIYSRFFKSMLDETIEEVPDQKIVEVAKALLGEIE